MLGHGLRAGFARDHQTDHGGLRHRQPGHRRRQIAERQGGVRPVFDPAIHPVLQRQERTAAQRLQEEVAQHRPGVGQRLFDVMRLASHPDPQQRFLHDILGCVLGARQAPRQAQELGAKVVEGGVTDGM